jgi:hypothetical protein
MGAPGDIGKQTGRVAQPLLFRGLLEMGRGEEIGGPDEQFLGVRGRAGA